MIEGPRRGRACPCPVAALRATGNRKGCPYVEHPSLAYDRALFRLAVSKNAAAWRTWFAR